MSDPQSGYNMKPQPRQQRIPATILEIEKSHLCYKSNQSQRHYSNFRRSSSWQDLFSQPMFVLYALIGVNIFVYLMWQYAIAVQGRYHDVDWLKFMYLNFSTNVITVFNGHWWTLLTAAFSHNSIIHLGFNMFTLYFFAPAVMNHVGIKPFLYFYIASAIASSLGSLVYQYSKTSSHYEGGRQRPQTVTTSLGASGSIAATIVLFTCLNPTSTISVFFIPMPAWVAVSLLGAYDLYGAIKAADKIDHAGHISGAIFGGLYFLKGFRR